MAGELHANCINCGKCQHPMDVDDISLFCLECAPDEAPCFYVCPDKAIEIIGGAFNLNKNNYLFISLS